MVIGGTPVWLELRNQPDRGTTDDRHDDEPAALAGKSPDADILREMIGYAAERLTGLEIGARTGVEWGEKNTDRLAQRNGNRERYWETRAGTVELRIPRLSTSSYFPASWNCGRWPRRR